MGSEKGQLTPELPIIRRTSGRKRLDSDGSYRNEEKFHDSAACGVAWFSSPTHATPQAAS